jgi:mRNA interferase HigB
MPFAAKPSMKHGVARPSCAQFGSMVCSAMRIIARRTLRNFVFSRTGHKDHAALKAATDAWFSEVSKANWQNMADVKRLYATASIVGSERMVFNIKGNDYRLVVAADFEKAIVWIKWIGTHRDYDRINVKEVKYHD